MTRMSEIMDLPPVPGPLPIAGLATDVATP
jgi:hypothetical protein